MLALLLAGVATDLFTGALEQVNTEYAESGRCYHIELNQVDIDPRQPVRLKAVNNLDGEVSSIGVIHLIKLEGDNFDERMAAFDFYPVEWRKIALTVDEVSAAIFARTDLFFSSLENPEITVIKETGQLFKFGACEITVEEDGTFSVFGKPVMWGDKRLKLSNIVSQSITEFKLLENGHITLSGEGDTRTGKGIFIDETGKVYRA